MSRDSAVLKYRVNKQETPIPHLELRIEAQDDSCVSVISWRMQRLSNFVLHAVSRGLRAGCLSWFWKENRNFRAVT